MAAVENMFDEMPPFLEGNFANGFDAGSFNSRGRFFIRASRSRFESRRRAAARSSRLMAAAACRARRPRCRAGGSPIPSDPAFITRADAQDGRPDAGRADGAVFDHLDLARKVFPDEKRIEGVTT